MGNKQSANAAPIDQQLGFTSTPRTSPPLVKSYGNMNMQPTSAGYTGSPVGSPRAPKSNQIGSRYIIDYNTTFGEGAFGSVHPVVDTATGMRYAVKVMDKRSIPKEHLQGIGREVNIVGRLNNPNIVKVVYTSEDNDCIYIVMEYYPGGDIIDYMNDYEYLNECMAYVIFSQLVNAVEYLHSINVIHRDIKAENLLYNNSNDMKVALTDFGFAVLRDPNGPLLSDFPGSPVYAAPELLTGTPYTGYASDVWAMGVTLYLLVCGYYPFELKGNMNMFVSDVLMRDPQFPSHVSGACANLIMRMLCKRPSDRITVHEIKKHPWMHYWKQYTQTKVCPPNPKMGDMAPYTNNASLSILPVPHFTPIPRSPSVGNVRDPDEDAPVKPPSGWLMNGVSGVETEEVGLMEMVVAAPMMMVRSLGSLGSLFSRGGEMSPVSQSPGQSSGTVLVGAINSLLEAPLVEGEDVVNTITSAGRGGMPYIPGASGSFASLPPSTNPSLQNMGSWGFASLPPSTNPSLQNMGSGGFASLPPSTNPSLQNMGSGGFASLPPSLQSVRSGSFASLPPSTNPSLQNMGSGGFFAQLPPSTNPSLQNLGSGGNMLLAPPMTGGSYASSASSASNAGSLGTLAPWATPSSSGSGGYNMLSATPQSFGMGFSQLPSSNMGF